MTPTIRIDDEVYDQLKAQAEPFVDTPNSVLRRLLGLEPSDLTQTSKESAAEHEPASQPEAPASPKLATITSKTELPISDRGGSSRTSRKASAGKGRAPAGTLLPEEDYEIPMLQALVELGDSASSRSVIDAVGEKLRDRLTDLDKEPLNSGAIRWKTRVQFVRLRLIQQGLMSRETGRGVWAISEEGKRRIEAMRSGVA